MRYLPIEGYVANVTCGCNPHVKVQEKRRESMAMTLGRRIVVLVVAALMALMMVAGPVASTADADEPVRKTDGKNNGWGDGKGGGKNHPKKNKGGGSPSPF
jgi:hypothetical protein